MNFTTKYRKTCGAILAVAGMVAPIAFGVSCGNVKASEKMSEREIPVPDGFTRLVFADESNYSGAPDSTKWGWEEGYVRNGELQYYTRGANAWCTDSTLVIEARADRQVINGDTCNVTSASLTTQGHAKWKNCFVEVRAKIPSFRGSWPAIWMMPEDSHYGDWPKSGEIDILEHVGYEPENIHFAAHSERYNHMRGEQKNCVFHAPDATEGFHIYGLKRTDDRITWYYDGREAFSLDREPDADWTTWPFNNDFYLILNLAVGGGWGGLNGVDMSGLPARYEIDYVRVFE